MNQAVSGLWCMPEAADEPVKMRWLPSWWMRVVRRAAAGLAPFLSPGTVRPAHGDRRLEVWGVVRGLDRGDYRYVSPRVWKRRSALIIYGRQRHGETSTGETSGETRTPTCSDSGETRTPTCSDGLIVAGERPGV